MQDVETNLIVVSIRAKVRTNFDAKSGDWHGMSQTWQIPDPVSGLLPGSLPELVPYLVPYLETDGTWHNRSLSAKRKQRGWRHGRRINIMYGHTHTYSKLCIACANLARVYAERQVRVYDIVCTRVCVHVHKHARPRTHCHENI